MTVLSVSSSGLCPAPAPDVALDLAASSTPSFRRFATGAVSASCPAPGEGCVIDVDESCVMLGIVLGTVICWGFPFCWPEVARPGDVIRGNIGVPVEKRKQNIAASGGCHSGKLQWEVHATRRVLCVCCACVVRVLGVCWACVGRVLGVCWACRELSIAECSDPCQH